MTQLSEIVYAVAVKGRVFRVRGYEKEVHALWQHALGAGVYAKGQQRTLLLTNLARGRKSCIMCKNLASFVGRDSLCKPR
jgi:hypothetical protein